MALVTTVAGETSDSYVSIPDADKYFRSHYSVAKANLWAALTAPQKESVLRRACQQIEVIVFTDDTVDRYDASQRLQFPREIDYRTINEVDVPFVPQEAKDAQCEQAVHMLNFDESTLLRAASGVIEEAETVGPIKSYVHYSDSAAIPGAQSYLSPLVVELLRPFFRVHTKWRRA